jgi:hypothetical protein
MAVKVVNIVAMLSASRSEESRNSAWRGIEVIEIYSVCTPTNATGVPACLPKNSVDGEDSSEFETVSIPRSSVQVLALHFAAGIDTAEYMRISDSN